LRESDTFKLRLPEDLTGLVRGMHPTLKKKVRASLDVILSDPTSGKALKDDPAWLRSFRIGRVRIIYKASKTEVQVVAIGPRNRIYEETSGLIRHEQARGEKSS
jgi:mRNA interferase RelE/StbE